MEYFDLDKQYNLIRNISEPIAFVKQYNTLVDFLNPLSEKYKLDISKCVRIEQVEGQIRVRITETITQAGEKMGSLFTEMMISLVNAKFSPFEFVFVENPPRVVYKFIDERVFMPGEGMHPGARIFCVAYEEIPVSHPFYQSLEDLIQYDPGYCEARKRDYKHAELISQPENIIHAKNFVITLNSGDKDGLNGRLLLHSITGTRHRGYFSGVHHLEFPVPSFIEDFVVVRQPDKHGVYEAMFSIRQPSGRKLIRRNSATMFPSVWSLQQFYLECYAAILTKVKGEGKDFIYTSITPSGVPVEIIFSPDGKFRSIYPVYTP